jgi:hypothetical protein
MTLLFSILLWGWIFVMFFTTLDFWCYSGYEYQTSLIGILRDRIGFINLWIAKKLNPTYCNGEGIFTQPSMSIVRFFLVMILIDISLIFAYWVNWAYSTNTSYLSDTIITFLGQGFLLIFIRYIGLAILAQNNHSGYIIRGYRLKVNDQFIPNSKTNQNPNPLLQNLNNHAGYSEITSFREKLKDIEKQCKLIAQEHVKFKSEYEYTISNRPFLFDYYNAQLIVRDFFHINNYKKTQLNISFDLLIEYNLDILGAKIEKVSISNEDISFNLFLEVESINRYIVQTQQSTKQVN